jgi:DNA sulfur modification protein DndD
MKLSKIRMKHFRQFYGLNELILSEDPSRNITIVHAENGVGKTALLNAVLWAMYGETTKKFEQKDSIINFEAEKENVTTASVEVFFMHKDGEYLVQRTFDSTAGTRSRETLRAFSIVDGNYEELNAPTSFVHRVIPKDIAKYFFFDGEHAETFSSEHNNRDVNAAIRDILGCKLVETAIGDLKKIQRSLNKEIGEIPGNDEVKLLEEERKRLELKCDQGETLLGEIEKALAAREHQIEEIEKKLRNSQGARNFQRVRDQKKRDLGDAKKQYKNAQLNVVKWVSEFGTFVVAKKLADASLEFIEDSSNRGIIPSPYNEEFVKALLEDHTCICDRPLKSQSTEFAAVMKLLDNASDADLRRKVMRAQSQISALKEASRGAPEQLQRRFTDREQWADKVSTFEEELGEISEKIKGLPEDKSREYEEARSALEREIKDLNRKIGAEKIQFEDRSRKIKQIEIERDKILSNSRQAEGLIRRRDLAQEGLEHLISELGEYEESARNAILKSVNNILKSTSRKSYTAQLDWDFTLWMKLDSGNQAVPKSGGENQLLSLAFIAALTKFSKLRQGASGGKWVPGTVAPLILDSPFGQLDPYYKESTATFIPQMAEQALMLVSSSQGDEKVLNAIKNRVGAEFVLISHNRGERGDKPEDRISLHGKEYVRSLYGQERNKTTIETVVAPE